MTAAVAPVAVTAASVYARLDENARELDALRRDNHKLRSEKANLQACLESERAEVARLRRENQRVCAERDTANALKTTGVMP